MPPIPNLTIPPSPPGSPPLASTRKFVKFLELKRQGTHFNAKLDSSTAIKNPAILPKLLEHAGIDHYDQYSSALPENLSVPTSYPPWAYGEELNKTQQKLLKQKNATKAKEGRTQIEFVTGQGAVSRKAEDSRKRQRHS
jgi:HCNGP-like protein